MPDMGTHQVPSVKPRPGGGAVLGGAVGAVARPATTAPAATPLGGTFQVVTPVAGLPLLADGPSFNDLNKDKVPSFPDGLDWAVFRSVMELGGDDVTKQKIAQYKQPTFGPAIKDTREGLTRALQQANGVIESVNEKAAAAGLPSVPLIPAGFIDLVEPEGVTTGDGAGKLLGMVAAIEVAPQWRADP